MTDLVLQKICCRSTSQKPVAPYYKKAKLLLAKRHFSAFFLLIFSLGAKAKNRSVCSINPQIPSHVPAPCVCAHRSVPKSSPQIVQTSPSRLAGASAVTSPIHPSLDACQPGAARAVSMETSNKRARAPPFTCVKAAAHGALRTNRLWGFFFLVAHLSP